VYSFDNLIRYIKIIASLIFKIGLVYSLLSFVIFSNEKKSENHIAYDTINHKEYISLNRFRKVAKNVHIDFNRLLLTVEVIHKKKMVRFQVNSKFYYSDGGMYPLDYAPVYQKNDVYMPRTLVEDLFTELDLSISYKFDNKKVTVREESHKMRSNAGIDFIVIDPGHGGKDPGASGTSSAIEKKITLDVSEYLNKYLNNEFPGVKIYMTRSRDNFVSLEKRSDIANKKLNKENFGVFISLHCNSTLSQNVHGYEVFYLSQNPGSEEDRKVMMRENDLLSSGDPDIGLIESYLLNSQILAESKTLARQLNRSLMTELSGHVTSRGVRKADFRVLRKSLMPAVLIEMGYISNTAEASVLQTDKYKLKLANAISIGIKNFIKFKPKM